MNSPKFAGMEVMDRVGVCKRIGLSLLLALLIVEGVQLFERTFMAPFFSSVHDSFVEYAYKHFTAPTSRTEGTTDPFLFVDIDSKTQTRLGRYPTHKDIAGALCNLSFGKPALMIVDLTMEYRESPKDDSVAAAQLSLIPNLVMIGVGLHEKGGDSLPLSAARFALEKNGPLKGVVSFDGFAVPIESFLRSAALFGLVSYVPDGNGRCSTLPLVYNIDGQLYPSVWLSAYAHLSGFDLRHIAWTPNSLCMGQMRIPMEDNQIRFRPEEAAQSHDRVSFMDSYFLQKNEIRNRIVILCSSAAGGDLHWVKSREQIWGAELLATGISSLTNRRFLVPVSDWIPIIASVVIGTIIAFLIFAGRSFVSFLLLCFSSLAGIVSSAILFDMGLLMDPLSIIQNCLCVLLTGLLFRDAWGNRTIDGFSFSFIRKKTTQ